MKKILAILMMSGLFLTNVFTINAQTADYFVTESGAGSGDGSSWSNASSDLQAIINSDPSGKIIFVAGGTYYPTRPANDLTNPVKSCDNAFVLKDGVKIYGGFAGTESNLAERNLTSGNVTTLSGDLNVGGDANADAYHVVIAAGLTKETVLDGVTVTGGKDKAVGASSITVNNAGIIQNRGGGIYIVNSSTFLTLTNVTVKKNTAFEGGGLYNENASPILNGTTVLNNNAGTYGGGIFIKGSGSAPELINVLIADNTAVTSGGGIFNKESSTLTLTNVTVAANKGGGIYNDNASPTVQNTIIWGNKKNSSSDNVAGSNPTYSYSVVEEKDLTGDDGLDATSDLAIFANAAAGDYTLAAGSPAINAGDKGSFTDTDVDLAGNPRIVAKTIDIGAFEHSVKASGGIVYVKDGGTGTGDGSSWSNAYPNLAFPLLAAADNGSVISEIWVAGGTYYPLYKVAAQDNASNPTTDRDKAFVLVEGVKIYGGFAGTEASPAARDLTLADTTFLSGDIGTVDDNTDNAYHVVIGADVTTAILDGVTVTGGNANGSNYVKVNGKDIAQGNGGGIVNTNSSPALTNVTVKKNTTNNDGGGLYNTNASPILNGTTVLNNNATRYGGGIYNSNSNLTIVGVTVLGNEAGTSGGGIFNTNSALKLINVLIADNTANSNGGGIHNTGSSTPTLTNVTVAANKISSGDGGGIYNNSVSPTVQNTIIWGNKKNSSIDNVSNGGSYYYSLVEGKNLNSFNVGNLDGTNPSLGDVLDENYCLLKCDSTVEGGDNAMYNTAVAGTGYGTTDLAGKQRISGIQIDMGALEFQDPFSLEVNTNSIIYGDVKNITTLTGKAPWTITYKIDGGSAKTSEIKGANEFIPDSAGLCTIVSIKDADNCTRELSITFTVNKRNAVITPKSGQHKTYGDSEPSELSYDFVPALASGDGVWVTGKLTRMPGENAGKYKILPGTLTIGNNRLANYNISFADSKEFTIDPAPAGDIRKENDFEWPTGPIAGPIRLPSRTEKGVPIVYTFTPSDAATLVDYLLIPLGGEIRLVATTTDPNYVSPDELHVIRVSSPSQPPILRQIYLPEVEGVVTDPPAGLHYAVSGTDYTFVLSPAAGREFEAVPTVRVSRPNSPDVIVLVATVTRNRNGTYTVFISGIIQNIDILIEAPVTPGTGNAAISGDRVWSAGDRLHIQATAPGEAQVYGQSGALVKAIPYAAGETVTELSAGIYFIMVNGKAQKVVISQ